MDSRPSQRDSFDVAIICALPVEYDAVSYIFDEFWNNFPNRVDGDSNHYTHGRIGHNKVVLTLLAGTGKVHAASSAASLKLSYRKLRISLLVGICGGVPCTDRRTDGILLGHVIIGSSLVQFDFGREYPKRFQRKNTAQDNLGRLNKDLRTLLRYFQTDRGRSQLEENALANLHKIQTEHSARCRGRNPEKYMYPGASQDKLFEATYRHRHRGSVTCCSDTKSCRLALQSLCEDVGCDERHLLPRRLLDSKRELEEGESHKVGSPTIHVGTIASGDTVMKCGEERDRIGRVEGVLAFEMEGAGVWDEITCLIVKGVSDYADSHKHKSWQDFAAAAAAAVSRTLLEAVTHNRKSQSGRTGTPNYWLGRQAGY